MSKAFTGLISSRSKFIITGGMGKYLELLILLKTYYEKKGNKIVWKNGLTLNQLSLKMWEELGCKGFDPSTLSRIINGKRLFTEKQLYVFCRVLNLEHIEQQKLYLALEKDLLIRHGIEPIIESKSKIDLYDSLYQQARKISDLRKRGLMDITINWSESLIEKIRIYLKEEKDEKYVEVLINIISDLIFEKSYALGCTLVPQDLKVAVFPLIKMQGELFSRTQKLIFNLKARIISSYLYYSLGSYLHENKYIYFSKSINEISSVLDSESNRDELELMKWRLLAASSIYLKKQDIFFFAVKRIRQIAEKNEQESTVDYLVWALETVARGQSYFEDKRVFETLEEIKIYDKKIQWKDPLRECAMIRNEIEVFNNLGIKERNYLTKLAKEGLDISKTYGYARYDNFFQKHLQTF